MQPSQGMRERLVVQNENPVWQRKLRLSGQFVLKLDVSNPILIIVMSPSPLGVLFTFAVATSDGLGPRTPTSGWVKVLIR
jgi:hypothetical protein